MEIKDREFYLSTKIGKKDFIYSSEAFRLSEIELLNLIKFCIVGRRNKEIGEKLLAVYQDSTEDRKELTEERLRKIGV